MTVSVQERGEDYGGPGDGGQGEALDGGERSRERNEVLY